MKKFLLYGFLTLLIACDDGDLQIETIDFDSVAIQSCDLVSAEMGNLLFKLNPSEALILVLPNGALRNEDSMGQLDFEVSASGPVTISYRTFSDNVTQNYFCSDIPPTTPIVVDEIIGQGGNVFITTTISADSLNFEHEIQLSGISLVTSTDARITNLAIDNFGTVTTLIPQETEEDGS